MIILKGTYITKMLMRAMSEEKTLPEVNGQAVKITHIKQMHMPPFAKEKIPPIIKEQVAHSQYLVAKAILANPDAIVLNESLYEDLTPEIFVASLSQPLSLFFVLSIIFPCGIPDDFSKLDQTQKEVLATEGAPSVLFYLGLLSHVYKTSTKEECKSVDAAVARGCLDVIFETREKQALEQAKIASIRTNNFHVLLVFGALHDFKAHIARRNTPDIIFQGCIDATGDYLTPSRKTKYPFNFDLDLPGHVDFILKIEKNLELPILNPKLMSPTPYSIFHTRAEEMRETIDSAKSLGNIQAQKLWDKNWGLTIRKP